MTSQFFDLGQTDTDGGFNRHSQSLDHRGCNAVEIENYTQLQRVISVAEITQTWDNIPTN
jgi:hypothetical protein